MKKTITNMLATTGIALIVLATVAAINGGTRLFVGSVFQTLGASIVIHMGLIVTRKFEIPYAALETTLDIAWTLLVLVVAGAIFGWYASTPVWMLVIMGVIVYLFALLLEMVRVREDVDEINKLLQKRNRKPEEENRA